MCLFTQAPAQSRQDIGTATGQQHAPFAIEGTVRSAATGLPLEGVAVRIAAAEETAYSDGNGRFSFRTAIADGTLLIRLDGYEDLGVPFAEGALKKSRNVFYLKRDISDVPVVLKREQVPDMFWDMPLHIVNHAAGRSVSTMRELRGDRPLLVLDFWTAYCAPCIRSVQRWEEISADFPEVAFVTVFVDIGDRALPFITRRGWQSPAVIGEAYRRINSFFFRDYQLGGVVMIYGDTLLALPKDKGHDPDRLRRLLRGEQVDFLPDDGYAHSGRKEGV